MIITQLYRKIIKNPTESVHPDEEQQRQQQLTPFISDEFRRSQNLVVYEGIYGNFLTQDPNTVLRFFFNFQLSFMSRLKTVYE